MSATTGIAWTDATFNIAWGCTKVSPGCAHCYAEGEAARFGHDVWGPTKPRRVFAVKHWMDPFVWIKSWDARRLGRPMRIFTSSMADVFEDHPQIAVEREKLWGLIRATPHVIWQVLTKRPENFGRFLPEDWADGYANVWLGISAEDQERLDLRLERMLRTPAAVHWISYEPALGPIAWGPAFRLRVPIYDQTRASFAMRVDTPPLVTAPRESRIDWVVVGGESGGRARPFDVGWARDLVAWGRRCAVPVFVKQLGAQPRLTNDGEQTDWPRLPGDENEPARAGLAIGRGQWWTVPSVLARKGDDVDEWPWDLRVREFPDWRAP